MKNLLNISAPYKYLTLVLLIPTFLLIFKIPYNLPTATANPSHIVFIENSFDEALKQAKIQNKYIFVDAYAMEKGQGPSLAAQWGLQAYPTLIIFNPNGKPVLGTVGYINAAELIRFGKQALNK